MAETRMEYLTKRLSVMREERSTFIPHYTELSQFITPRRGRYTTTDRNKGDKRWQNIINSKATMAHRVAKAGMLAGFMSPSRPWFTLKTPDPAMMEFAPVKIWLNYVEKLLYDIFNASNLYNMAPSFIGELLVFGTGAMSQVDDFEDVARFYTHTAGSYMIAQDDRYVVDTFAREFEWSVRQIVRAFGTENLSPEIKTAYDRSEYEKWFQLVQFIEPNADFSKGSKFSKKKKYRSVVFEPGRKGNDEKFLSEMGFDEFPVYVPRWEVTGEDIYGTDCPGMTALGDIKGLQVGEKRQAQAIDKMVDPPLSGPPSLRNVPVSNLPGGLTVYDAGGQTQRLESIYNVQVPLEHLSAALQRMEMRIDTIFYVDLFLAITGMEGVQPRNELELTQRNQERLLQLGPVLERVQGEWLSKMIDRTFNQAIRAGIVPPAPPELAGKELTVDYISALAMAQKAVATNAIRNVAMFVGEMAEIWPEVRDKFDADQAVDEYAGVVGAPPKIILPDEIVAKQRQQRQKMQQAAQALEMAQSGANTAKMLSDAKTSEPSMLTTLSDTIKQGAGGGR